MPVCGTHTRSVNICLPTDRCYIGNTARTQAAAPPDRIRTAANSIPKVAVAAAQNSSTDNTGAAAQTARRAVLPYFSAISGKRNSPMVFTVFLRNFIFRHFDNLCIRRYIIQARRKKNLRAVPVRFFVCDILQLAFGGTCRKRRGRAYSPNIRRSRGARKRGDLTTVIFI